MKAQKRRRMMKDVINDTMDVLFGNNLPRVTEEDIRILEETRERVQEERNAKQKLKGGRK